MALLPDPRFLPGFYRAVGRGTGIGSLGLAVVRAVSGGYLTAPTFTALTLALVLAALATALFMAFSSEVLGGIMLLVGAGAFGTITQTAAPGTGVGILYGLTFPFLVSGLFFLACRWVARETSDPQAGL